MLYFDDTVIFFFSALPISEIELQLNSEVINLSEWLSTNNLILSLKKTEFTVFGILQRRQNIDGAHIMLGGESVKHCDAFKYLGVVLDSSLSFNLHIDHMKKKVSKTLGMFSRIRSSLTTEVSNGLYKSTILPNLKHCCAVFHGCSKKNEELERLQKRAPGIVLKTVHLSTQDMVSGLGWDPLKTRGVKHAISVEAKSNKNLETKAVKLSDKWKQEHSTSIYTAHVLFTESNYHEQNFLLIIIPLNPI